jgi:hypothetical protein
VFSAEHRHELFDDAFQEELEAMYRQTGQGQLPRQPALMCMALLLQAYVQTSDAEAVRLSTTDRCWQMVLGTLDESEGEPAFSQGGLQQFRDRLITTEMDRRLLERTVELAKVGEEDEGLRPQEDAEVAACGGRQPPSGRAEQVAESPRVQRSCSAPASRRCVGRRMYPC